MRDATMSLLCGGVFCTMILLVWRGIGRYLRCSSTISRAESTAALTVSLSCIVLTGALLVAVTLSSGTAELSGKLLWFLHVFSWPLGSTLCIALLGVLLRNRQMSSEMNMRAQAQAELEAANHQLVESLDKLKKAQQQMIHQERIKAVGQMASGISHDFGNALMPVVGLSRMLLDNPEQLEDREETLASLRTLNAAAKDAREVSARLKEFYRPEAKSQFEPVDVNDVIQGAVLITQPRWQAEMQAEGRKIDVKSDLTKVHTVMGSSLQLREVLTNLIFNAMDVMPDGGTIRVRTGGDEEKVCIEVQDTGTGMSKEVMEHCFDAFYSTKDKKGTGMGLAMVQEIITRHSGTVSVESELGKGTTFKISLPAGKYKKAQESALREAASTVPPLKILIVDDHVGSQEILRSYLERDNHTVTAVDAGARACELLKENKFDLVVTDRAMPDLNGDMVAIAAKTSSPDTAVIMLTGFGDMMLVKNEYPAGVDMVIAKPVDPDEMRRALVEVIEKVKQ